MQTKDIKFEVSCPGIFVASIINTNPFIVSCALSFYSDMNSDSGISSNFQYLSEIELLLFMSLVSFPSFMLYLNRVIIVIIFSPSYFQYCNYFILHFWIWDNCATIISFGPGTCIFILLMLYTDVMWGRPSSSFNSVIFKIWGKILKEFFL